MDHGVLYAATICKGAVLVAPSSPMSVSLPDVALLTVSPTVWSEVPEGLLQALAGCRTRVIHGACDIDWPRCLRSGCAR